MKKGLKRLGQYCFACINLLVVAGMVLCGWSYRLNSHDYPDYSFWGMLFPFFLAAAIVFLLFWLVAGRRFMLISIVGMGICADAIRTFCPLNFPSKVPEGAIKVLSYNVMGFGDYKDVPWNENIVLDYILRSQADIVCLQEGNNLPLATMHQLCDSLYPHIVIDTVKTSMNLILMSKYPIVSTERIRYESQTNGSFAHKIVKDEDTILVINNHLESYQLKDQDKDDYKTIIRNLDNLDELENKENEVRYDSLVSKIKRANYKRGPQADSIAQYIEQSHQKYVICMGDFNAPSLSYTHYRLTRLLNDAYTRSGNGVGFSYNRSGMYFRIDNILVSENIKTYAAKVDAYSKMSDHYPIYAWLLLEKQDK